MPVVNPPTFRVEPLEQRTFLSAAPADVLSRAVRQQLLDHLNLPNKSFYQAKLDDNKMGAFDGALLSYMKSRPGNTFFWKTSDVASIKNFINGNLATATTISNADHIVAHQFPDGNSAVYDVKLPAGDIDWSTSTSNPDFAAMLNRQEYWGDLSQAYVLTGRSSYVKEIIAQLASWSDQNPPLSDPGGKNNDAPWQPLGVAVRANAWTWAYQMVLGSSGWTADANTLFLYELYQHGERLREVEPYALNTNRALFEGQGLLQIAQLVPEFDRAKDWKGYARGLLFDAMDTQLNPDGGHVESSPGYAENVVLALLEMFWLDQKKGEASAWDDSRLERLKNAAKAQAQLLTPDAKLSPLSDTYRSVVGPFWDRARIILNDKADFPAAKPRLRDVWLFGGSTAGTLVNAPVYPKLQDRGKTYAMPQSGYYVMRSGSDANARQIVFDAGPTGGGHGHFDLLNFELFGYGKPLIADPGLYAYDNSVRRNWAISTPAHNTISVDGLSHAAIEGVDNTDLASSGLSNVAGGYQVTASHQGYKALSGSPTVSRSIWYDGTGVMLIADRGQSSGASHTFTTSFLLPGTNASRDLGAGWIHSNNAGGGNVSIQTLLQAGQAAHRQNEIKSGGPNIFVSSDPDGHIADDSTRFYVDQNGTNVGFVTLVTTYSGTSAPNVTAKIVGSPTAATGFAVQIYRNGKAAELIPFFVVPGKDFRPAARVAGANDVAWDSKGRLHLVYNDRKEKNLKYSVRDAAGNWSAVQTIDTGFETGGWPSLAVDANGIPAVAYFDGGAGDLKFAKRVGSAWQVQTVDSSGSTGLYPSLVLGSDGTPIIGYYNRTNGELRLAAQSHGSWKISTIDSKGDVGRCTSMALDPNRKGAIAIAYDDSATGAKKFAYEGKAGWAIQTVDNATPLGGGYTSLAYEPYRQRDGTFHATISYYDSSNSALKFARHSAGPGPGGAWGTETVISSGTQGLYTSLFYDGDKNANILFFKKNNTTAYRAVQSDEAWSFARLGTGGREAQASRRSDGTVAYTNLDADGLRVEMLPR